jgi:hypothetical protein
MITLERWLNAVKYDISEGYKYHWHCYGANVRAYLLEDENREYGAEIVFNTETLTVYEVSAIDYVKGNAYRIINPEYADAFRHESESRGFDPDEAWEDVKFITLETDEDYLEKLVAIINGQEYDDRVVIPLDLDRDTLFTLAMSAHEQDITLNQHFVNILKDALKHPEVFKQE